MLQQIPSFYRALSIRNNGIRWMAKNFSLCEFKFGVKLFMVHEEGGNGECKERLNVNNRKVGWKGNLLDSWMFLLKAEMSHNVRNIVLLIIGVKIRQSRKLGSWGIRVGVAASVENRG